MSCEVTVKDIQRSLKNRLLEEFDTAKPINGGQAVFISINIGNKNFLGNQINSYINNLNKEFGSELYGESLNSYKENEFGYIVEIKPPKSLADAMTAQNIQDEMGSDFYMGDDALREQEDNDFNFSAREQQNSKRPLTDNFIEYKNYKQALLDKVRSVLKSLHKDKRNPKKDLKKINSDIERLANIEANLKNDIDALDKKEIVLMFHAISEEINELNNSLNNTTDIENFKDRLDFLYKFIKGVSIDNKDESDVEHLKGFNHPDFEKISLAIDDLNLKYKEKLTALRDEIINSDISYVNNVLNNQKITDEDLKNMFNSPNDINWMEKTFLGIGQSSNNDTVLPQILKSFLETKVALREAEVKTYKDRLNSLRKKIGNDFDFIFEKTEKGVKTGNIVNVISPKFNKMLSQYLAIDRNEDKSKEQKYTEKVAWLKQHTEVIDFRKLKVIKDLFGNIYPEHFTATEEEMDRYESHLRNTLGPLYEDEIAKVQNNLENFQASKESILQTDNQYKLKNIARIDPWAFIAHYNSPFKNEAMPFDTGSGNTDFVYSDIQNIRFIPIKDIFVAHNEFGDEVFKSSGYYNPQFDEISKDNDKLEYWKLMNEIYSEYISPTYGNDYTSKLSYAKFEEDWIETVASAKGLLKGSALFNEAKKGFKSFFYEKGHESTYNGIKRNYSDSTNKEIREMSKVLKYKDLGELQEMAKKQGIDTKGLDAESIIREIATDKVISSYSSDINKVTTALLDMAALQKAKEDTLPIANIILDAHKLAKDEKGNERKQSIDKLEHWIDRVIKNQNEKYRGGTSFLGRDLTKKTLFGNILDKLGKIPFVKNYFNKKKAFLLTDNEKEMLKHLEDLKQKGHNKEINDVFTINGTNYYISQTESGPTYTRMVDNKTYVISQEEYEKNFQKYIENKISSLGLDLNTAGVIQGILKMIILKGLGLNPISGIFNRIEGKNSGLIMDQTGSYWTKGNIHAANNFMAFANFIKFLPERFTPDQYKKVQELEKLQVLLHNMNLIQDRKNELDRNAESSKFNYEKLTNIYQFAVDNPEFKNQGAILLSILMDTKIKDVDGNEVAVFDGTGFPIYDNVGDKLVLKPEFRTEENISNWENFDIDEIDLTNNQYLLTRNKIKNAISRSQGNYDNLDVIDATRDIWVRSLTLFMKWMPEHFMQRFSSGKGFDLSTGEKAKKGRYRYLWANHPALLTTGVLSLFTGFGLTPVTGLVGLGFTGFVVGKYFMDLYGNKGIQREANNTMEFVAFAKSIVINTLNYPLEFFNRNKMISQEFGDKIIPGYSKTNLSQEEINNLQAIAKELGIKLTFLAVMLLAKKLTWDDDDDEDSDRRQLHNFLDNQLSRMISSLSNWTNPEALASDVQRMAFLKYLWDVVKLMKSIVTANSDGKLMDNAFKASPLPRILHKGTLPWHDEREYENKQWQDRLIKDSNSGGEWSKKKEYEDIRKTKKEEFREKYKSQGLEGDELDEAVDKDMQLEFPKKKKGESYSSILSRIESGEKGKAPKTSRRKKYKETSAQSDTSESTDENSEEEN